MKKLILLAFFCIVAIGCGKQEDPLRYKGCVIICKSSSPVYEIELKLSSKLRDSLLCDYIWISVPEWEFDKLNIGDTIK